jgi:hypothetical protein
MNGMDIKQEDDETWTVMGRWFTETAAIYLKNKSIIMISFPAKLSLSFPTPGSLLVASATTFSLPGIYAILILNHATISSHFIWQRLVGLYLISCSRLQWSTNTRMCSFVPSRNDLSDLSAFTTPKNSSSIAE